MRSTADSRQHHLVAQAPPAAQRRARRCQRGSHLPLPTLPHPCRRRWQPAAAPLTSRTPSRPPPPLPGPHLRLQHLRHPPRQPRLRQPPQSLQRLKQLLPRRRPGTRSWRRTLRQPQRGSKRRPQAPRLPRQAARRRRVPPAPALMLRRALLRRARARARARARVARAHVWQAKLMLPTALRPLVLLVPLVPPVPHCALPQLPAVAVVAAAPAAAAAAVALGRSCWGWQPYWARAGRATWPTWSPRTGTLR